MLDRLAVLEDIRTSLAQAYGNRLEGVVLFGSVARGDDDEDSDIDVLVLLNGPVRYGQELEKIIDAIFPLSLKIGRPISAKPVELAEYERARYPLYQTAAREGIRA